MGWKDSFKNTFDVAYQLTKSKKQDIRFPCYGGKFHWFLISYHFDNVYFYLTDDALIYTDSGAYLTEIPFCSIKKLKIKQGWLFKHSYQVYVVADKKYHFQINEIKDFSTELTGKSSENVERFLDMLRIKVHTD